MDVITLREKQEEFFQSGKINKAEYNQLSSIHQRISEISSKTEISPEEADKIGELLQSSSNILLKDAIETDTTFTQNLTKRSNQRFKQCITILLISTFISISIIIIKGL
ncbi:hypothetical protein [Microbulbifer sp. JTAC008]|uniref:hypothetical protein n=1 Tax=unclassified Microbulbifer TaxID=2619833 RepID=UPI0040395636